MNRKVLIMKDHYEIKKRDLPYYDEIGFREL